MLEARHVFKSYNGREVLRDVSLAVTGRVALMAPSGWGKTTLMRLLLGLETPDAGEIARELKIGAVFQEDRLIERMTAADNARLVAPRVQLEAHFAALGLKEAMNKRAAKLSGGMRRRVALIRAVAFAPDALLLDEPFKGLDEAAREAAIKYIDDFFADKPILIATHDAREAELMRAKIARFGE